MAVRRATRAYASVVDFLEDHAGSLAQGALLLPPGTIDGEPAPQLKLDLVIPPLGRIGPIPAQVVHRGADGSVALRIPEWPPTAQERISGLLQAVEDLRTWFNDQGTLVPADQVAGTGASAAPGTPAPQAQAQGQAQGQARGRGFAVPDFQGIEALMSGQALAADFRELMLKLGETKATGVLTLQLPGGPIRYGFWQNGGPVGFRTEPMNEGEVLGVLLYKAKQIDKAQLRESLDIMKNEGVRQGEAFIQMGLMTFPQLVMVLGKQVEFLMQRVLKEVVDARGNGSWTFHALERPPERFLPSPLKVPAMLLRGAMSRARELRSDTLYQSLSEYLDLYIFPSDRLGILMSELRFSAVEVRFLETLKASSWRVREAYSVSPMSRAITASFLVALIELNLLEFRAEQSEGRKHAELQEIIDRKKSQTYGGSHFDILEVHWICVGEEVEAAKERLLDEFAPRRFKTMDATAQTDVKAINERIKEAYRVLSGDASRREYRKSVIEEGKIQQSADLLGRQGEMAILRNDRRHATTCYTKAIELVPGRPDFRNGLSRARGLSS